MTIPMATEQGMHCRLYIRNLSVMTHCTLNSIEQCIPNVFSIHFRDVAIYVFSELPMTDCIPESLPQIQPFTVRSQETYTHECVYNAYEFIACRWTVFMEIYTL